MTGRELIIYILQNNLVDKEMFPDGVFVGFMDELEAAAKFNVGTSTILAWNRLGMIKGFVPKRQLYFYKNTPDPRIERKE